MRSELNRREFIKVLGSLPLLKLAVDLAPSASMETSQQEAIGPNILVIVFDALSATNVSLYGYPRLTTPNFSRFAEKATVFNRHYAGGSFTSPGTASVLTGTYPWTNRAFHLYGTVAPDFEERNLFHSFAEDNYHRMVFTHNDLAAMLLYQFGDDIEQHKKTKELCRFSEYFLADDFFPGDHNAAFLGERTITRGQRGQDLQLPSTVYASALHRVWRTYGKQKQRAEFKKSFPRGLPSTNAGPIQYLLEDATDWVKYQVSHAPQPFLGYFHFLPPHEPYNPHKDFINIYSDEWQPVPKPQHFFTQKYSDADLNGKRKNYDEYIAYADAEFGKLLDHMEKTGLIDNTVLVVTSDHGEMFERGILEHITPTLYEPITRVPLVISRPGQGERIDVDMPTSCTDLLPTLLHAAGKSVPDWVDGQILPTFSDEVIESERSVYTVEAKSNPKPSPLRKGTIAMVKDRYKLIYYFGYEGYDEQYEMYDLLNDPEELENLYSESNATAGEMKAELHAKIVQVDEPYSRR
ncbi:MAG: sulfatase-like hydrolase/transferase [Chloroflexota bacterium]|nr:MAG: sulfatase-like hydrolase/transferase [Chloroflexota bacterium]